MALFFVFFKFCRNEKGLWVILLYTILNSLVSLIYNYYFNTLSTTINVRKAFYSFLTLFEYFAFTYFFFLNIRNSSIRKFTIVVSSCFLLFIIIYYFSAKFHRIDSVSIGVETILILIFSGYFLYEQLNNPDNLFIYNDYRFWIVLAFMIYLSGSLFIYLFANQISQADLPQYWMFTDIFYTLKNIFFSIGILVFALQPKQKHHTKPRTNHHYLDIT